MNTTISNQGDGNVINTGADAKSMPHHYQKRRQRTTEEKFHDLGIDPADTKEIIE